MEERKKKWKGCREEERVKEREGERKKKKKRKKEKERGRGRKCTIGKFYIRKERIGR